MSNNQEKINKINKLLEKTNNKVLRQKLEEALKKLETKNDSKLVERSVNSDISNASLGANMADAIVQQENITVANLTNKLKEAKTLKNRLDLTGNSKVNILDAVTLVDNILTNIDCCEPDPCESGQACMTTPNGCECWTPDTDLAQFNSYTNSENLQYNKNKIYLTKGFSLEESDNCCDTCKPDEACMTTPTGCECWTPNNLTPFKNQTIKNNLKTSFDWKNTKTLSASDDCCDQCAPDEACMTTPTGCECWLPDTASIQLISATKKNGRILLPEVWSKNTTTSVDSDDCCDQCEPDEACMTTPNGCECWLPDTKVTNNIKRSWQIKTTLNTRACEPNEACMTTPTGCECWVPETQLEMSVIDKSLKGTWRRKETLSASDDCCDQCAEGEACMTTPTGCECWVPDTKVVSEMKTPVNVGKPLGTKDFDECCKKCGPDEACMSTSGGGCECWLPESEGEIQKEMSSKNTGLSLEEPDDCCDNCLPDEACMTTPNGCECWVPNSDIGTSY